MELTTPDQFLTRLRTLPKGTRSLVGIAGPPGAGKSTSVEALAEALNGERPERAAILPMDGYHFDDAVLEARGDRVVKGAPHTFDVGGLTAMLDRLRLNQEREIAVPRFDRALEISRAGAALISQDTEIVLVEGNYLLLGTGSWKGLRAKFDMTALIRVDKAVLRQRLVDRWVRLGFSLDDATERAEQNDLPNGLRVLQDSQSADLEIDGTLSISAAST